MNRTSLVGAHWKAIVVTLLAGIVMGSILVSPAAAALPTTINKLWKSLKPKVLSIVYTKSQSDKRYIGAIKTVVKSQRFETGGGFLARGSVTAQCPSGYSLIDVSVVHDEPYSNYADGGASFTITRSERLWPGGLALAALGNGTHGAPIGYVLEGELYRSYAATDGFNLKVAAVCAGPTLE